MQRPAPCPVLPARRSWPLHGAATSRAIEQAAAAALPAHALMARAGLATARLSLAIAPHAQAIDICCGPGNNGGDGLIAAIHLLQSGKAVRVWLLGEPSRRPPDALDALQRAQSAGVPIESRVPDRVQADLVLDALLGLGASRIIDGPLAQAVERINASAAAILAVDLPSGLHADTGDVAGRLAVCSSHTLSLLTLKPGLFTGQGREWAGRVWFDALAVEATPASSSALLVGPELARLALPVRRHAQHKGSFGNALVIGGAAGMVGAAMLAARAALAAGAGRVFLGPLAVLQGGFDSARPEVMVRDVPSLLQPQTLAASTVVCGCGGAGAVREVLPPILHHTPRLVLDADALNAIASEPGLRRALRERAGRGHSTIVTPHPLEAARLLDSDVPRVQSDRLRAAQDLADDLASVVVLKGSGTVLTSPGSTARINPTGNARLATAGTGDVLAGWLGGLWAQQDATGSALDTASCAVWLHGRAAEQEFSDTALRAADLIDGMARVADALQGAH